MFKKKPEVKIIIESDETIKTDVKVKEGITKRNYFNHISRAIVTLAVHLVTVYDIPLDRFINTLKADMQLTINRLVIEKHESENDNDR